MPTPPSPKLTPAFEAALRSQLQTDVSAIVRCDRLDPAYVTAAEALGLKVVRRLRLIRGLAVEGPASALLKLAEAPWVLRIEPDQPVHITAPEVPS